MKIQPKKNEILQFLNGLNHMDCYSTKYDRVTDKIFRSIAKGKKSNGMSTCNIIFKQKYKKNKELFLQMKHILCVPKNYFSIYHLFAWILNFATKESNNSIFIELRKVNEMPISTFEHWGFSFVDFSAFDFFFEHRKST